MMYGKCLRLARRTVAGGLGRWTCPSGKTTPSGLYRHAPGRALATGPPDNNDDDDSSGPPEGASRTTKLEDHTSFRQHRLASMDADRLTEEPLYPDDYPRIETQHVTKSVPELLQNFEDCSRRKEPVTVMGRVRSKRVHGSSLIFLDIVNEFQMVQVLLNKKNVTSFKTRRAYKFAFLRSLIQVGDHISVTGTATRSLTGEPTIDASMIPRLLSPSMSQLPDSRKVSKTSDQERHVDMLVNRSTTDILRLRSEITRHMRNHFHSRRFLEMQTPILAEDAGGAIARPFRTRSNAVRSRKDLALRVAPELWLKRLVVGGFDKVFEIGPAFRNEGVDASHNPEFTMCEFYSAYTNLENLIKETEELIHSLAAHCKEVISTELVSLPAIDLSKFKRPFKQVEFVPALEEAMGVRLPKLNSEGAFAEMLVLMELTNIKLSDLMADSLPKLLDQLAAHYLEPMSMAEPIFIINHPSCMSPLAKSFLCPKTYQLVSARAELFVCGRELANMYEEENSPHEQRRKLALHRSLVTKPDGSIAPSEETDRPGNQDDDEKQETYGSEDPRDSRSQKRACDDWVTAPLDRSYIRALDYGLPPTGGWGCGVERLVMLFSGSTRIGDCLSFGTLRHVVGISAPQEGEEEEDFLRVERDGAIESESSETVELEGSSTKEPPGQKMARTRGEEGG
ncbi:hypothetical protein L249_0261 [Ophiocordyceps polyrhachis-furcata BCC 54312]|uniref:Lysyl-tRNA synthetase n=1 Tax=Ophiocordyceps polyrhachis-furcata BCC 54312 TaxID=1330021 RepID=A0A367LEZ1_9HYPO|nr:hypothetical protein L249_0261 [Ophiocordyceps polyrhachis-furcata BCC 54312]